MADIRPFLCIRPKEGEADKIAALPYDVYSREEAKEEVYRRFNNSLVQGGVLFIGSTEQIMSYRELNYQRNHSFFFQKL